MLALQKLYVVWIFAIILKYVKLCRKIKIFWLAQNTNLYSI